MHKSTTIKAKAIKETMSCKLCLKDKKLVRQSHIIPAFMYKDIFDEKHRLFEVTVTKDKDIIKDRLRQTGANEGQILCQSCDNEVLGKLERYASLVLFGGVPIKLQNITDVKGMKYTLCEEIDYAKFKLFILSLLWRASISKLPDYNNVNLGPHEDKIRQMILNSNSGGPIKYPCVMASYRNLKEAPHQFIGSPGLVKDGDGFRYLFLIGGVLYIFYVSHHNIPDWADECAINSNGELKLLHLTKKGASAVFKNFIGVDLLNN
ncbi:MAG: hypothetical protein NTW44_03595 [Nitrospirae bacterium]|nr:hypothetical protein [Nitrospirota bacterium]